MTGRRTPIAVLAFALALGGVDASAAAQGSPDRPIVIGQVPNLPSAADDLPAPPKMMPAPGNALPRLAAPDRGREKFEVYDYPGEYAQRFDGVAPGGSKSGHAKAPKIKLKLK
jgi:uncharacterized protein involved in type VI secretion and phage assembly